MAATAAEQTAAMRNMILLLGDIRFGIGDLAASCKTRMVEVISSSVGPGGTEIERIAVTACSSKSAGGRLLGSIMVSPPPTGVRRLAHDCVAARANPDALDLTARPRD